MVFEWRGGWRRTFGPHLREGILQPQKQSGVHRIRPAGSLRGVHLPRPQVHVAQEVSGGGFVEKIHQKEPPPLGR
ncbi:MAG: hypothetical protein MUP03_01815 [Anaerolineales bacterium]|nr:hypothetical protein [Anaerolineales bacterium]